MLNGENIIEIKNCKQCNASFNITDKDLEFYEKISPKFNGKKYLIPSPTFCPDCRQQRRLAWRNERKLYKRKCDASGENIISVFSPDKNYKVYNQDFWWSDKWDALDYSKSFDFSKTFFEQFDELLKEVPHLALLNSNSENTYYANYTYSNKNCYLCFAGMYNEDSYYSKDIFNCSECIDCSYIHKSQYCYECIDCVECYKIFFSQDCISSGFSYFLKNCENCKNCFGCLGLKNKNYHFFNIEYSPEEYEKKVNEILENKSFTEIIQIFNDFLLKFPTRVNQNKNTINCFGDYLLNSKNCYYCFEGENIEDSKYLYNAYDSKNCYDANNIDSNSELIYEGFSNAGFNLPFSMIVWFCENCYYSLNIHRSKNCFGCIGLRDKEYCILNKQYSKEEYEELVPKIIEHMINTGEWGEFFPASISPFGYNEAVVNEYFPLSKEDILCHSGLVSEYLDNKNLNFKKDPEINSGGQLVHGPIFKWSTYEPPFPKVDKIIKASMLPEDISKIPDDILNWAIECEKTGKPFRIVASELEFYRKHNLPIPRRHPDERHLNRLALRNPRKLFDRNCDKCGVEIKTTYSPDRKEIVYCESCYEKKVY